MALQQIQAGYWRDEDRLLLRISYKDDKEAMMEIRSWMSRHLVKTLWPNILHALEAQVKLDNPNAAHASSDIVNMEHQAKTDEMRSSGNFDVPFAPDIDGYPFGEQPILLVQAHITVKAKESTKINFVSARNGSFELGFTRKMLYGFCTVLQDAVKLAEWDIELHMPASSTPAWERGDRVLN